MKTYAEFAVTAESFDAIVKVFRRVLAVNAGWKTSEKHNRSYSQMHGERSFYFSPPKNFIGTTVAVAFAGTKLSNGRAKMHITNIVPKESSQVGIVDYNRVVDEVRRLVIAAAKQTGIRIRENHKSGDWDLKDVIPGKTARTMFERWLAGYPKTFHPDDVQRLDFFTIALHHHKSKPLHYYVKQYLIENLKWSEPDARLVENRIIVGLQVLDAKRRYWRGV